MAYPKRAVIDTIRTIGFAAIGAGYIAVGAAFAAPVRIISIKNTTNENIFFSDDGVNDKFVIPAGSGSVYDLTAARTNQENLFLAEGGFAYIRRAGGAPTSGNCYIEIVRGL